MQFEEALQFYKQQRRKILAQHFADFIISWDMQTDAAPQSISADAEYGAVLSEYSYELVSDEKFVEAVETLDGNRQLLDDVLCHEVEVMKKNIRQTRSIPKEEYSAYNLLVSQAYPVYVKAKTENDFELFRPYLEKIVDYCRKTTVWLADGETKGYDVLLDMFEPHYTTKQYDEFFALLKEKLVPLIKKVSTNPPPVPDWATQLCYKEGQKRFCEYLRDVMCFDKSRGIMKESEHPFTSGFGTDDVRITNHYYENNVVSAIYSVIHETGHALYEQQCDRSLNGTERRRSKFGHARKSIPFLRKHDRAQRRILESALQTPATALPRSVPQGYGKTVCGLRQPHRMQFCAYGGGRTHLSVAHHASLRNRKETYRRQFAGQRPSPLLE